MKIMPLLFLFIAIQISLMIYVSSTLTNDGKQVVFNDAVNGSFWDPFSNYNSYSKSDIDINYTDIWGHEQKARSQNLWDVIWNPWKGNTNLLIGFLIGFATMIGALAFFPFINRSDLSMLSAPFLFILLAPTPVLVQLYSFINKETAAIVGDVSQVNFVGQFLAVIIVGPLFLSWALACWENWTGRPVS